MIDYSWGDILLFGWGITVLRYLERCSTQFSYIARALWSIEQAIKDRGSK